MIAPQTFNNYPEFGSNATKCCPDATKYTAGFIQGETLPAEYLNWFLSGATVGVSLLQQGVSSIENEILTLLTCAGIAPNANCNSQIYDGIMNRIQACMNTRSPTAHASSATTYGVGNASCYGHLKISDTYTSVLSSCTGVAASQKAVACVYSTASSKAAVGNTAGCALGTAAAGSADTAARSDHVHPIPSRTWISNCVGNCGIAARWSSGGYVCLYATNSSGACTDNNVYVKHADCAAAATASCCACCSFWSVDFTNNSSPIYIGYANAGLSCEQVTHLAAFSTNYSSGKTVIKDASIDVIKSWLGLGSAAYCSQSCFLPATGTACVAKCITDGTAVGVAECTNEFNIYPKTGNGSWINYRGGSSTLWIGDGSGNGCYGSLRASTVYAALCGTASCSRWVKDTTMRQTNANVYNQDTTGGMTHFLATSEMTTAKPATDGHIIHMSWDNNGGYGAQIFVSNDGSHVPQYRAENGKNWTNWTDFITSENIGNQCVFCATCACTADYKSSLGPSTSCYTPANYSDLNMCVCYNSAQQGGLLCICNKRTLLGMIVSYKNECEAGMAFVPPSKEVAIGSHWACGYSSNKKLYITNQ